MYIYNYIHILNNPYIDISKYIQILNNLSHDVKLIIDSEIQIKTMSIKYILCEGEAYVLATTKFNFTLVQIPF